MAFFNEGDLMLYLDEQPKPETASGFALPLEDFGDVGGYASILRVLRLERSSRDPREMLAEANNALELRTTPTWKHLEYADQAQIHVGALFDVLTRERTHVSNNPENRCNLVDSARLQGRQVLFDTAFAAESVLAGVQGAYWPEMRFTMFSRIVDWTAYSLDVNAGDTRLMWAKLQGCYASSILPQFGLKMEERK